MQPAERLIVALDVQSLQKAQELVRSLLPMGVTHFKVGLGLFTQAGPAAVEMVQRNGGQVFLDLKFHDIPTTVAKAAAAATRLGVWMMNLHIQGGSVMMRQALAWVKDEAVRLKKSPPFLVGVTVLTSMADRDLVDLGIRKTMKDQVLYLAKLAQSVGLDGIVASAQEATVIRWACGEKFLIVTPGIRSAEAPSSGLQQDDQQRSASPLEAVKGGADYLVVGRPILEAVNPKEAAQRILEELRRV